MMIHHQPGQEIKRGWITAIVIIFILLGALIYLITKSEFQMENKSSDKIQIVVSFYPLADFAKNVGKDYVQITNITPAGAEPHDYEPAPQEIAQIYNSKLFVFNGNSIDSWADKIRSDLEKNGVIVLKMSEHMNPLNSNYDPHFWLNPLNAIKETNLIADALIKIDPAHGKEYNKNRDDYNAQLIELDREYKEGLANCKHNEIITSHNAFYYLSEQYGFTALYILGLSPDAEPSPKAIADISDVARNNGIKYIFFETLVSPKISETIANEVGAQTLVLNPIEGLTNEESQAGKNYINIMKDNLTNLRAAMQCK